MTYEVFSSLAVLHKTLGSERQDDGVAWAFDMGVDVTVPWQLVQVTGMLNLNFPLWEDWAVRLLTVL